MHFALFALRFPVKIIPEKTYTLKPSAEPWLFPRLIIYDS